MEAEGQAFLAKVADGYLRIAEEHPERFVVIDGAREQDAVFDDVRAAIDKALRERQDHDAPRLSPRRRRRAIPCPRMNAVLDRVAGQEVAMTFLRGAAERPHHAYVLAGPEGSGKSIAARAFVASLLCHAGGCGTCRDCSLALRDQHPNEFVVEPEGRDIHIDTIREEIWQPAYRTAPEPGRKVFVVREADRLSPPAADTLLKVLEEPPLDTVFLLLSARAHELPDTILSRCHVVTFAALPEAFVVAQLEGEGVEPSRALLAARLSGGNVGRARRMATDGDGLSFRDVAAAALTSAAAGPAGALAAAGQVLEAATAYKKAPQGRARCGAGAVPRRSRVAPRTPTEARSDASRPGSRAGSVGPSATSSIACCWPRRRCLRDRHRGRGARRPRARV